ncbi:MAG TPA: ABC transporter ATP-binding protein [Nocardioidaceae bacterium]|nr:ABC transporter ATP-binding protein [Nocardioidaceae bacterium]
MTADIRSRVGSGEQVTGWQILRRGFALSPALRNGLGVTILLAAVSTIGAAIVPIVIQKTIDDGLLGDGGIDRAQVWTYAWVAGGIVVLTAIAAYWMKVRLYRASEAGLAELRIKAFRHVHDLPVLTQDTERRGALVSRVTSDVDQVSLFLQFSGILMIISLGQILVATVIMAVYSWQLTLIVWACFLPLVVSLRHFQKRMSAAYATVRQTVGDMLSTISEPVVGAAIVRAHDIAPRTQRRVDGAIDTNLSANVAAQRLVAVTFASAGVAGGLANASVVVFGILLGLAGSLTIGTVIAFAFLVSLLVGPVQMATQVLTEAQNAIASWRRVIGVLDTPADVVDPGESGVTLPRGTLTASFHDVDYAYPDGPPVLRDVSVEIERRTRIAVVGETGSGKTTFAKLLCRLMDPTTGRVCLDGVDLRTVRFDSLRERVVMVPQEGFLFDASLADNLRYGRPGATDTELVDAFESLRLADWFATLPAGLETQVGQRGESLSAGERQLVALVRAYLADPDLLVLDEATSAVDPQTELRITAALDTLLTGRTSVIIAHRLSTAEQADQVLVFDAGRLVEQGPHTELVVADGDYARLHRSWVAQAHLGASAPRR